MGTPDFAVHALQALYAADQDIVAVYCQPPKPAGRGQHLQKSPVQLAAETLGIAVHMPKTLRDPKEQKIFKELNLDVSIVAAYGLILPQAILDAPKQGCLNIHGSLLPRWRGAAPIQRAMLAGDAETGITIMQMDSGLDTGPMLLRESIPITSKTTAGSLHDQMAKLGAKLIIAALNDLIAGKLLPEPQPTTGATYAAKLTRENGRIDWALPATTLERQVRALQPWPGCYFKQGDEIIKILAALVVPDKSGTPGTILDQNLTIACGSGALQLLSLQRPGKKPVDGASFLNGLRLPVGAVL